MLTKMKEQKRIERINKKTQKQSIKSILYLNVNKSTCSYRFYTCSMVNQL